MSDKHEAPSCECGGSDCQRPMTPENQRDEDLKLEGEAHKLLRMSETDDLTPPFRVLPSPSEEWIFWKAKTICRWVSSMRQSWEREKKELVDRAYRWMKLEENSSDKIESLEAEKKGLEDEAKYLREHTHCSYCDFEAPVDIDASLISKHIQEDCKNHPYAILRDEITRLKAENERLRMAFKIVEDANGI